MLIEHHLGVLGPQTNLSKPHLLDFIDLLDKDILCPFLSLPCPQNCYSFHKTKYKNKVLPATLGLSRYSNTLDLCAEHWACHRHQVFFVSYVLQFVTIRPNALFVQNRVTCVSYWRKDSQTSYNIPPVHHPMHTATKFKIRVFYSIPKNHCH